MRWWRGLVVILVYLATACAESPPPESGAEQGQSTSPLSTPAGSSATTSPAPSPSPTVEPDAIRKVRLGTLEWYDVQQQRTIPLGSDGRYTKSGQVWTGPPTRDKQLHERVFYADLNGDGFLDALAALKRVDGRAYAIGHYIWVWDPAKGKPVQVRDLVAMQVSCGDYVTKITAEESSFVLTERLREYGSTASCAEGGSVVNRRTITLRQGHLVTTAPYAGYGGICDMSEFEGWYQPYALKHPVHLWPDKKAPLAIDPKKVRIVAPARPDMATRTWPKGWIQVTYISKKMDADGYELGACGFSPAP